MGKIIDLVVIPALIKKHPHIYRHAAVENVALAPFTLDPRFGKSAEITIIGDDEAAELRMFTVICRLSARRRTLVLRRINHINATTPFVRWAIHEDPDDPDNLAVVAAIDVELAFGGDLEALVRIGLDRLLTSLKAEWRQVVATACGRSRTPRWLRDVRSALTAS